MPVTVVEQRTIGPTLGAEAIRASTQAAVIGVSLTILFMAAYYRLLGGLSAVALGCYGLLSFAVLPGLWSTLTLPGIAGFVLAIGMAVDAGVLVFERMKEEHRAGVGLRLAVDRGFRNALSAVADFNVTTLLAVVLLLVVLLLVVLLLLLVVVVLLLLLLLVALFVLGGDTLTDFALALLVGILIGTYSSVFVAAPLVVALARGRGGTAHVEGASWRRGGLPLGWAVPGRGSRRPRQGPLL